MLARDYMKILPECELHPEEFSQNVVGHKDVHVAIATMHDDDGRKLA